MIKKLLLFISGILLTTQFAISAITWQRIDLFDNRGGLNDGFSSSSIADNEASDIQNIVLTTYGSFKTRSGFASLGNGGISGVPICIGITNYRLANGTKYLVVIFDNNKIYKMDYATGGAPDGTWDNITGSLSFAITTDNLASFATGEDELLIEDGLNTTPPSKWTGTGNAAAISGAPNATLVAYHKRMAFAAGNNTNASTLYFTDVGDIDNWTTGLSGNVSIETNDGSIIRAIIPGFDALYIFKDYSIWRLTGDDKDTFVLQRMVSGIGCRSPTSVAKVDNSLFFLSTQGYVYIYDGGVTLRLISTKIQGTIDNANFSRFPYALGLSYLDDYYLILASSSSTQNDIVLFFDTYTMAWTKFSGMKISALCVADNGSGKDVIDFGIYYHDAAFTYPSGTNDHNAAIDTYYLTKWFKFPQLMATFKDFKLLNVYANQEGNYNLTAEIRKDFAATGSTTNISLLGVSSTYGTAVYGTDKYGGQNIIVGRIEPNLEGTFFQIKYSNSNKDEPFEVRGYEMFLEQQDRQ